MTAEEVLEYFFDPDINEIELGSLAGHPRYGVLIDRLRAGHSTALPFRTRGGATVDWFGIARNEAELRELRDGIEAFIGSTWAEIEQVRLRLGGDTAARRALTAYSDGRIFKFTGDKKKIGDSLLRMFRVWGARPTRVARTFQAPGLIRHAFESALQVGDAVGASDALAMLRDSGVLDRKNALFLEIQRFDALGDWSGILDHPELNDLLASRRPAAVTDALLRGAYHRYLAPLDSACDATAALDAYRSEVAPVFGGVLDEGTRLRSIGARFVAAASAADREDWLRLGTIHTESVADGVSNAIFEEWLASSSSVPIEVAKDSSASVADPLSKAESAGRLDKKAGFALAANAHDADPAQRAALLLSFANDIRSMECIQAAFEALEALDEEVRQVLEGTAAWVPQVIHNLGGFAAEEESLSSLPSSWSEWLSRLVSDRDWTPAHAARLGEHEWTVDTLLEGRAPEEVATEIGLIPSSCASAFADSLPHLLNTLQSDRRYPDPSMGPVYAALLEHVAYQDPPSDADVRIYTDLLPAVLAARLDASAYAGALDGLVSAFEAREAAPPTEVLLDALDSTIVASCPDTEVRLRLFVFAGNSARRFASRWSRSDLSLLHLLAIEAGCSEAVPLPPLPAEVAGQETDPLQLLAERYVAIYTLTESAGNRAAEILLRSAPGVRVETSGAFVGDSRLASMAKNADIFVMVTRSAQHAATDFITAHRDRDAALLRPLGKGTASILRALREYVRSS